MEAYEQDRIFGIATAWEVWGEASHEVRRLARTNEWSGDFPSAAQRATIQEQFAAQIFEAYARARLQCAVVAAADGVAMVEQFDQHWVDTWGAPTLTKARDAYAARYATALERQRTAREQATAQREALEAAGVRSDLEAAPLPTEAAHGVEALASVAPANRPGWGWLRSLFSARQRDY